MTAIPTPFFLQAIIGEALWTDVTETRPAKRDDGDET